jgi:hypothetical protein
MLIVGVEPPELPLLLLLVLELVFALAPPLLLLLELFELDPQAATTSAVIATSSTTANGRTCLLKLNPPPRGWCPKPGKRNPKQRPLPVDANDT